MKINYTRRGFTLIELLVVVLIIGILAAVAVPQYKFAVTKTRMNNYLPLAKSIAEAQKVYYLANGTYAFEPSNLDVEFPSECTFLHEGPVSRQYRCGNSIAMQIAGSGAFVTVEHCSNSTDTWDDCKNHREFQIVYNIDSDKISCAVANDSSLGQKICNSLFYLTRE